MGVARKRWSPDERREVLRLNEQGFTYKQIAEKLRPGVASAWRSVGEIVREDRNKKNQEAAQQPVQASGLQQATPHAVLPTIHTSSVQLPAEMSTSLSAAEFMLMLDDDQKRLFIRTYQHLRGEADEESLTNAENEMLIRAAFSNVKYLRAQALLARAEAYMMADMEGGLTDSDEDKAKRRFAGGREGYKKEVEQFHKEYRDLLDDLKLTRKQRLDKIKDTRNTFLDLQTELVNKVRQDSLIEDIKRINMATDEEFRRMARGEEGPDGRRHSWLVGAFDDYLSEPEEAKEEDKDEHST